ncbi:MAG: hypothetical protein R3B67_09455 [Phycisphaerales bacterium]
MTSGSPWDLETTAQGKVMCPAFDQVDSVLANNIAMRSSNRQLVTAGHRDALRIQTSVWDVAVDPSGVIYQAGSSSRAATATPGMSPCSIATTCPADLTGDGQLDFFDVTFLNAFTNNQPSADFTGDGLDFFDVTFQRLQPGLPLSFRFR